MTGSQIGIYHNDVILDGQGDLTIHGDNRHRIFEIAPPVTVELRGITVTGGRSGIIQQGAAEPPAPSVKQSKTAGQFLSGGGIANYGTLTLTSCTVSENTSAEGGGIYNSGTLILINSTVSGNTAWLGGALSAELGSVSTTMTLINSTVSGNTGLEGNGRTSGISTNGALTLINSTVSGNVAFLRGTFAPTNSLIDGACDHDPKAVVISNGNNIESPGDTCGFGHPSDQVDVSAAALNLGLLQDDGGPTETHALGAGSVAIDQIPPVDCGVTTDQRGEPRPGGTMCDVGAFEVQP